MKATKKMAMGGMGNPGGGMRGLDRAAAMSGRTMPATGRPMKKGGMAKKPTKKMMGGGMSMGYAKGGSASKRADGIARKGKTKGTMIAMRKGGKTC
jgi:hypothetical protein